MNMPLTRQQLILTFSIAAFCTLAQMLAGTAALVAVLFGIAALFGTLAVFAGGGLKSAFGCLNAILIGKFLLFAIGIKFLMFEPADGPLHAPVTTGVVMALGFAGLLAGTLLQSRVSCPQTWSLNRPFSPPMLLSFSIVLFAVSYLAFFASLLPSASGQGLQTGGWLGVARALASLKSFAIVPPMLY
jgi:hypothetical protein